MRANQLRKKFDPQETEKESLNYCQTRKVNKLTQTQQDTIIEKNRLKTGKKISLFLFLSSTRKHVIIIYNQTMGCDNKEKSPTG
jgi:hypothetical protein